MKLIAQNIEQEIYQFVDGIKDLLSSNLWNNLLMDCSKNEVLVLWLLYRQTEANMSQIADYIHVPLNTATGVISRMEKKKLVVRERSEEDKRIVTICLNEQGRAQIQAILQEFSFYAYQVSEEFSREEIKLLFSMLHKLMNIMKRERKKEAEKKKVRKIVID